MNIYFVAPEHSEQVFLIEALKNHTLYFVKSADKVPPEAEFLSVFINVRIDAAFLDAHPHLRFVATRSTTYDHIDLAECARRNVTVSYVPSYGDHTVAEHTMALMLALARRLREAMECIRKPGFSYQSLRGFQLRGKTLGVIGTGRIGLHVVRLALAFGMRCIAYDPRPRMEEERRLGFQYVSLTELLCNSDILSLHAALTPESFHMLDEKALAQCKHGIVIINTARGALIDTKALLRAMEAGIVAGVGVDVLEDERVMRGGSAHILTSQIVEHLHENILPMEQRAHDAGRVKDLISLLDNGTLLAKPNVIFTPHIAFNSVEAIEQINRTTVENIEAFAAGAPIHVLTPEASTSDSCTSASETTRDVFEEALYI